MKKDQRYKYEMLVRVREFGMAQRERFPESSNGGSTFMQVAAAVGAIDEHLKNRVLGRVEGRGVKPLTRAAVYEYMKTIAKASRRVTRGERDVNPFRMPARRTLKVDITTARAFIEQATPRRDKFIAIGLPPTFISEFTALVDELQEAVDQRLASKTVRGQAQAGIAAALAQGFDHVLDLDVIVAMAARQDPVLAAAWRSARRIEGQNSSASTTVKEPVTSGNGHDAPLERAS